MKKLLCVILATIMVVCSVPFTALAETIAQDNEDNVSEEEYIYYSDLFYGYSTYLPQSYYLLNYSNETQQVFNKIYSDYMDSPMFIFSDIKHSLPLVFNVKEYTKLISDLTGLTSFTYENALDKANIKFAEELMGESTLAKTYGTENKWVKNINKFLKVYDTFEKNYVVYEKTEIQIYEETFEYFVDNGAFSSISVTNIEALKEIVLPKISEITKILSAGSNVLKGAQTLMLGLMIEDIRACIIDEVLGSQQKNTTLYDGMSRLKKQLSNGFVSYFYYNYIEKQLLGKVADFIVKELTNDTIFVDGGFKLIGAIVDVACYVVFDVIFDVPDIDDLTTQAVLTQYSNDFFYLVRNKASDFLTQFDNEDISDYETLFTAYQAATNAAYESSDKITLSSNSEEFNSVKLKYYKKDIYSNYIDNVKEFIRAVPKENRVITDFGIWTVNDDYYILGPSDIVNDNVAFHAFQNGLYANVVITNKNIVIPESEEVVIHGDLTVCNYHHSIKLENNGELTVEGNVVLDSSTADDVFILNNGIFRIFSNISGDSWARIKMNSDEAILYVAGNINIDANYYDRGWSINAGKVILNGDETQHISNFNVYDMEVVNPKGICLESDLCVYGNLNLNGYDIIPNGYKTKLYENANLSRNTNYHDVIIENTHSIITGFECDSLYISETVTIPESEEVVIHGDLTVCNYHHSIKLENNGELTVEGNVVLDSSTADDVFILNNGIFRIFSNISGDSWARIKMNSDEAILYVAGNINIDANYYDRGWSINAGKVILNGDETQHISNFNASTFIIENASEEGVIFNSSISPSVLFDHNGNNFTHSFGGTFVDYDGDGIKDNVDPFPLDVNILGDIDYNKIIDVIDLTYMRKKLLGFSDKNHKFYGIYDVNLDGSVDICDLVAQNNLIN